MAYEKHTWETGEVITAEKLNNLEGGIESLENNLSDALYEYETLFDDTLNLEYTSEDYYYTMLSSESWPAIFNNDSLFEEGVTLKVTIDGTEYIAPYDPSGSFGAVWSTELNGMDFSTFPFSLVSDAYYSQIPGPYHLKIERQSSRVEKLNRLEEVVLPIVGVSMTYGQTNTAVVDKSFDELYSLFDGIDAVEIPILIDFTIAGATTLRRVGILSKGYSGDSVSINYYRPLYSATNITIESNVIKVYRTSTEVTEHKTYKLEATSS